MEVGVVAELVSWLPFVGTLLAIFLLRVVEVSLATLRIILLVRGRKLVAATVAFFASITWVVAAAAVLTNLHSPARAVVFALGYAAGTVTGGWVEERIALGKAVLRIVTPVDTPSPAAALRRVGLGVTVLNAEGLQGPVRVAFTALDRRRVPEAMRLIREVNPGAFVTVEDTAVADIHHRRYDRR